MGWKNKITAVAIICLLSSVFVMAKPVAEKLREAKDLEGSSGDIDSAIAIYEEIVADEEVKDSYRAQAHYGVGVCYMKKGDEAKATEHFKKLVSDFESPKAVIKRAELQLTKIEIGLPYDAKIYRFKPAKPKQQQLSQKLNAEGWKLWRERNLVEAEQKFKKAVENDPGNANALNGLGWAQLNQGKKKEAKVAFSNCVQVNKTHAAALNGLGYIARGEDQVDLAIKYWKNAVKASPKATASLSGLTAALVEKEDYEEAIKYYEIWAKQDPSNQKVIDGLNKAKSLVKIASMTEGMNRGLLDEETLKAVTDIDAKFAQWYRVPGSFKGLNEAGKSSTISRWIDEAVSEDVKRSSLALANLGNVKAKKSYVILVGVAEDPMVESQPRWLAVRALGMIGDVNAVPSLIELVDHPDFNTQIYAKVSLAELTGLYFSDDKEAWYEWWFDYQDKVQTQTPKPAPCCRRELSEPIANESVEEEDEDGGFRVPDISPKAADFRTKIDKLFAIEPRSTTVSETIKMIGQPDSQKENKLNYNMSNGFDMFVRDGVVREIHINNKIAGELENGIAIGSDAREVFAAYQKPRRRKRVDKLQGLTEDRVLFLKQDMSRILYRDCGLIFWFRDNKVIQIVQYKGLMIGENVELPASLSGEEGLAKLIPGKWQSVDFVSKVDDFTPKFKMWNGDLFLKGMAFHEDGSTSCREIRWVKDIIIHAPSKKKFKYYIKEVDGNEYLFFPWISGDVTVRGEKPRYYVLKRI